MQADAVVIGAGVIGSSIALGLTQRSFGRVVVIDADLSGELASSTLNVGGVRATWWCAVNIELSKRSLDYFWTVREKIMYRRLGYLWLYDKVAWPKARQAVSRLNRFGLGVEALTPRDVLDRTREIDCVDGVAGATFSPLDGLVDSARIKLHYQEEAKAKGAIFLDRWFVGRITQEDGRWRVSGQEIKDQDKTRAYLITHPGEIEETLSISAPVIVNAAGPWAARIANLYGDKIPSAPQRRQVFYVKHPSLKFEGQGMIVDDSGAFIQCLPDDEILCGFADPAEPMGYRFEWDGPQFYREMVLPKLARRISLYPQAELIKGWARLYDHSPDRSGMIGRVRDKPGLFQAHSFSGHGVMQSYGAGQALSELITDGQYKEWKIAEALNPYRFEKGERVFEPLYI